MASQRIGPLGVTTLVVLVAMLWTGATAQSDCTNVIISMSPCLNYITGNSSAPTSGCCTQLGSVVRSRPECLCQVLNGGGSSLGLDVNQTQAEALPGSCKVQTPPLSSSNMYPSQPLTASSPNGSPAGKSDSPTKVPSDGSGRGSSDGSYNKLPTPLLFFLLFVASYASTFTM